jgi:hypothetical protein
MVRCPRSRPPGLGREPVQGLHVRFRAAGRSTADVKQRGSKGREARQGGSLHHRGTASCESVRHCRAGCQRTPACDVVPYGLHAPPPTYASAAGASVKDTIAPQAGVLAPATVPPDKARRLRWHTHRALRRSNLATVLRAVFGRHGYATAAWQLRRRSSVAGCGRRVRRILHGAKRIPYNARARPQRLGWTLGRGLGIVLEKPHGFDRQRPMGHEKVQARNTRPRHAK